MRQKQLSSISMPLWQRPQQGRVYGHNADMTPELLSKGVLGHHLLRVSTDKVPCNLPEAFWETTE